MRDRAISSRFSKTSRSLMSGCGFWVLDIGNYGSKSNRG
jgi:hypothetical protein